MKKKIIVIGSYAVGMSIVCERFPVAGETVPGSEFLLSHGGKGSNQAIAAARMGGRVVYATRLGHDEFGDKAMQLYEQEAIDASFVKRSDSNLKTGVGLIYVNQEGENEIVIDFAANREFSRSDVDEMMPEILSSSMVLMQLEGSMDTVEYTAHKCKENGIPFVLNPAPYVELSDELLMNCTYITPNQTEGRRILGIGVEDAIADDEIAKRIRNEKQVENVILTMGSQGAYVETADISEHVEGIQVSVLDTTGAGDTFTGAFCVALSENYSILEAVRFANVAAGLAVTKLGVVESIPHRSEVEQILNNK